MREIRLFGFDMACVGHIQQGMWRHPRDRSADYHRLGYWTGLAQTLEAGLFDGLFLADVQGVYDVFGASPDAALRDAVQVPLLDPWLLVPAMAAATRHLGFAVTGNIAYEPPYPFARRLSTLDHLAAGRLGWNVVTGYLDSAARALGQDAQRAHDDRYAIADEFLDVVYALWEGSWQDDAVRRDAAGVFAEPSRVRAVRHDGPHYRMEGIHLCEPSPQRTPVLFQAGASDRGRSFAARHAECVFLNGTDRAGVARQVAALRAAAAPRPLLALVGATVVVGRTEGEAQEKLVDYAACASADGVFAHASASLGIDLARFGMDEPIAAASSNAVASNVEAMRRVAGPAWTKRDLLRQSVLGSRQPPIVGDPVQVADALMAWVAEADVDGFNLSRTVTPECFADFATLVVPELQERGVFKRGYEAGTLRERLFGSGPRLTAPHPAAAARA